MTEFYKVTGEKMRRYQKIRNVLLTVIVTLALQCTFEVCLEDTWIRILSMG